MEDELDFVFRMSQVHSLFTQKTYLGYVEGSRQGLEAILTLPEQTKNCKLTDFSTLANWASVTMDQFSDDSSIEFNIRNLTADFAIEVLNLQKHLLTEEYF